MYYVVYSYREYKSLPELALDTAYWVSRLGRKPARVIANTMGKVDQVLPNRTKIRSLVKATEEIEPRLRNKIRFGNAELRKVLGDGIAPVSTRGTFPGQRARGRMGLKNTRRTYLISLPPSTTKPIVKTDLAHELGHAVARRQRKAVAPNGPIQKIRDEFIADKIGAEVYRKAGGSRFRYWFSAPPNYIRQLT